MDTMKITVYTLHHGVHYFYLPNNSPVYLLRQSLENRINVPLEHLRITHHFNDLSDDDILPDNNVFMVHECPKVSTRSSSLGRIADLLLKCSSLHTNTGKGKGKGKGKKRKIGERDSGGESNAGSTARAPEPPAAAAGPSGSGAGSLNALNADALNASLQAALDTWPTTIARHSRQEQFALTLSTYLWTEPEDASTPEDSSSSESPEPMETPMEVEPIAEEDMEPWVMPIRVWRHDEVYKMRRAARLASRPPRLHGAVALLNNVVEWVMRHRPAEVHRLRHVARWTWQCERPTQRLLHHMTNWLWRREGGIYVPPHIRHAMNTVTEPLEIKRNPRVLCRAYQFNQTARQYSVLALLVRMAGVTVRPPELGVDLSVSTLITHQLAENDNSICGD